MGTRTSLAECMTHLHANDPLDRHPQSYYAHLLPAPKPWPQAQGQMTADLCVIGGGLTGLSAALHASQGGLSVIVLEAARVGWGASGRSGGQIGSGLNWAQRKLAHHLGKATARAIWQETETAKAWLYEFIATHVPEAKLQYGILNAALTRGDVEQSLENTRWIADHYGYETQVLSQDEVIGRIGTRAYLGGVLDPGAGFCHPLAVTLALGQVARSADAWIYERSEVLRLDRQKDHWQVTTRQASVKARTVLQATNGLGAQLTRASGARILPLNNYIAVTEPLDPPPMQDRLAVSDSRFVVNYFWQTEDGRLLYGGGESYGRRFPRDIAAKVRSNLARVYPHYAKADITHAWGGTLAVTPTRLPYIAQASPGLFIAGGYSGHGLALAPHAGRAVAEHLLGHPERFNTLAALPVQALPGGRFLGGLITNAAMAAGALGDWLTRPKGPR